MSIILCIEKLIYITHRSFISSSHFPPLLAILIDGLSSNDWNVRHQSVTAIHSLGMSHYHQNPTVPQIEKHRDEIMAHLERLKYDKVSNVRNVASETLAIWMDTENDCIAENELTANGLTETDKVDKVKALRQATSTIDIGTDDIMEDKLDLISLEKPWYDRHERKDRDDGANGTGLGSNEHDECGGSDHNDHGVIDRVADRVTDHHDNEHGDGHSLLLQQQQLMLKTIQNLESYIRREVGGLKTRIHAVERDMQRIKVSQQNKEWMHENRRENERNERNERIQPRRATSTRKRVSDSLIPTFQSKKEKLVQDLPGQTETMSMTSDQTQVINLNQQLLNIIKLDNNTELIQWLIQTQNQQLFEQIDQRLMVSLIYRVTQLLKNKKYTNDIISFLKKEFVTGDIEQSAVSLPSQLKSEFIGTLREIESIEPFINDIVKALE